MAIADRRGVDEALDWVRRIHDPSFSDWEAHAAWLEADPANLAAFDEACLTMEATTAGLAPPRSRDATPMPVNDNHAEPAEAHRHWPRWAAGAGMAVAAALLALVAVPPMMAGSARPYVVQTAAGEHRSLALADGTAIAMNGGTRLRLDRRDTRMAVLEQGEAFFTVRHDAAHPFAVHAGDATFQDVGTAFNVVHQASFTQVTVRDGAVLYDPAGAAVRLDGGQSIRIAKDGATVRTVDGAAVGGWRAGRLTYRNATLADVAMDVARSIGETVSVDPALAGRQFSGVVIVDADRPLMFRRLAVVTGVAVRRDPQGWRMVMPPR